MAAKIKVAILGSTGMLGSMVLRVLTEQGGYDISVIDRAGMDAERADVRTLTDFLTGSTYAINCIGIIKPRIDEGNRESVERAIRVNSLFPHVLAAAAERVGCRVLQIATDCVYSGRDGRYSEGAAHDATDVYGKTKSLGEIISSVVTHLRCSIIGPEQKGHLSLLDWFLNQPVGSMLKGFNNHLWNGITTLHFARICHAIMSQGIELPCHQHVVPRNAITKRKLISHFAYFYKRDDVSVGGVDAPVAVNRTLVTSTPLVNSTLWLAAGYSKPPYIQQMIEELAAYQ